MAEDSIKKLGNINENLALPGHSFQQRDDYVKFFKLVDNEILVPEVTGCIHIDQELHVKLFSLKVHQYLYLTGFNMLKIVILPIRVSWKIFLLTYCCKLKSLIAYLKNLPNTNARKNWCILLLLSDSRYYTIHFYTVIQDFVE